MKRSSPQNRYYHGVIVKMATEYYKDNVGDLIRDTLLAVQAAPSEAYVHELFKMMFNGGNSTTKLNTAEFEEFALQIRAHHDVEHGNVMPLPNEIPIEAYDDK